WSGNTCNAAEGADVACNGAGIGYQGRHSIEVTRTTVVSGLHCLSLFEDANCNSEVGIILNQGGGSCVNVNTGTAVNSFRCFSGNTC
ncbi:hypothetical protein B0H10DRAFT_1678356, partial [Mycena sp. CBHHK59/15]